jgi:hypothetical protein
MRIKIEVTQDDIDSGKPRLAGSCPIALALIRAIPDIQPEVMFTKFWSEKYEKCFDLTDEAYFFILAYDDGAKVKPFSFEIDIP